MPREHTCGPSCLALALALVLAAPATAREKHGLRWSGQLGVASGMVYRGMDLSAGQVTPNFDMSVEHDSGLYLHGWLTRVAFPRLPYYPSDDDDDSSQVLADVGYHWRPDEQWTLTLAHYWYHYDQQWLDRSPDYREWYANLDYDGFLAIDYAHTGKYWGMDEQQDTVSVSARWPLTRRLLGAATLGWVGQSGRYADDYTYLRLNLAWLWRDWSVQLQFHDSSGVGNYYSGSEARRKWVAQLNWYW